MFYALTQGKIDREGLEIEEVQAPIHELNQKSLEGTYEVSAISFHVLPAIAERYQLLQVGACFGENYGPVVIASRALKAKQLRKIRVAIPGKSTTAFLVLKMLEPTICYSEVPFDQVIEVVASGKMEAGLLIHEGQLTYQDKGLFKVVDLGEWWQKETDLPLPLGGIVVRRDLDWETASKVRRLIQASVRYALEHKEEALEYALPFARGLGKEKAEKFVGLYVNDLTVDCGRRGQKAIKVLLEKGAELGFVKATDFDEMWLPRHPKGTAETVDVETPTEVLS
jgi:1,4-dihydroxy-6-naphthoate synthase